MFYVTEMYGWGVAMPDSRWEEDAVAEASLGLAVSGLFDAAVQSLAGYAPGPEDDTGVVTSLLESPVVQALPASAEKGGRWVQAGWRQVRYHSFLHNTLADTQYRQPAVIKPTGRRLFSTNSQAGPIPNITTGCR